MKCDVVKSLATLLSYVVGTVKDTVGRLLDEIGKTAKNNVFR